METHVVKQVTPQGFVEMGVVTFEGKDYVSGGAAVSDSHLVCYPDKEGNVKTWGGEIIGRYHITGTAGAFHTRLTCYRITLLDGRQYVGRGPGSGMILKCHRASQPCPTCQGRGKVAGLPRHDDVTCGACGGSGKWWTRPEKEGR